MVAFSAGFCTLIALLSANLLCVVPVFVEGSSFRGIAHHELPVAGVEGSTDVIGTQIRQCRSSLSAKTTEIIHALESSLQDALRKTNPSKILPANASASSKLSVAGKQLEGLQLKLSAATKVLATLETQTGVTPQDGLELVHTFARLGKLCPEPSRAQCSSYERHLRLFFMTEMEPCLHPERRRELDPKSRSNAKRSTKPQALKHLKKKWPSNLAKRIVGQLGTRVEGAVRDTAQSSHSANDDQATESQRIWWLVYLCVAMLWCCYVSRQRHVITTNY